MAILKEGLKVLIVSSGSKTFEYFSGILPQADFSLDECHSASEARRIVNQYPPDILIIDTPLPDEFGVEFASDVADINMGIMLLVKAELLDRVSYDVEKYGILTLSKPNSRQIFYNSVKLLAALSIRLKKMENKNISLQNKMNDIRAVNRAKWILIEKMNMTEQEAHYFIEKQAMDSRISRREVAESIVKTYDI